MADSSFRNAPSYLYSSESVTEGHPDKLCDQVSDAILDAIYAQDPAARVACETATTTNLVMVLGEITTTATVDYEAIVRKTLKEIGYNDPDTGIDYKTCRVLVELHEQSPDISQAVTTALEHRNADSGTSGEVETLGAGDQGMMVGFACNETPELMPLTIVLSHRLTQRLSIARKEGEISYLRPDGKSQVTVEYAYGVPKRIHTIIVSTQHQEGIPLEVISKDIRERVINPIVPEGLIDDETKILVNPSGKFVVGGPHGDAGLTGRKILVDTYGGVARHGGGAFSGKDPTKVDRSAAYAARYVAKNVVAAGLGRLGHSFDTIQISVREMEDEESVKLFQKVGYLSLIAATAPMMGLLGTVTGMFVTFGDIADAGGSVSPAQLAGGIKLALVTTIFGLIVAIPVGAFFFMFRNRVLRTTIEVNAIAEDLFERFRASSK